MEPYIKKSALVAEIERIKKEECPTDSYEGRCKLLWFEQFLSFLDTIETKEVDLGKELDKYTADNFWALEGNNESPYLLEKDDMLKVAKYFYELGLKVKDVNEIIKTAEDHAYFAGSENTREKLIEKACKWLKENAYFYVNDYTGSLNEDMLVDEFHKAMEK